MSPIPREEVNAKSSRSLIEIPLLKGAINVALAIAKPSPQALLKIFPAQWSVSTLALGKFEVAESSANTVVLRWSSIPPEAESRALMEALKAAFQLYVDLAKRTGDVTFMHDPQGHTVTFRAVWT